MGKILSDYLHQGCMVMNSDYDRAAVMTIIAGFNLRGELTVVTDFFDYEDVSYNCSTAAVVNEDDARAMARRHKVSYRKLPWFISECMAYRAGRSRVTLKQVRSCFKEITECLLDEGCRFRIERTEGRGDRICC